MRKNTISRRCFVCGTASAIAGAILANSPVSAQQNQNRAINDPNIIFENVEYKSGDKMIGGYLARPKKKGKYRAVAVIPGTWMIEPYIAETTAMVAQAGFVGLAIDVFNFFPKVKTYEETDTIAWETTRDLVKKYYTNENTLRDVQAGMDFLKQQKFVKGKHFGVTGFCGGGWLGLLAASQIKEIGAVVPFYAPVNLKLPNRKTPMDVAGQIKVPVQGHYGTKDQGIPIEDVKKFEETLKAQKTKIEIFTYDAGHGFFAYNRDESYNAEAAKLAWSRSIEFFKQNLKT
ncbi:MAG TPA: dienelactone hydrolase family protein [Pyrinomonadaceae bacterium]|nr:dienelactone hydrolase family protein [Pyrinomonadaceae bacterium]